MPGGRCILLFLGRGKIKKKEQLRTEPWQARIVDRHDGSRCLEQKKAKEDHLFSVILIVHLGITAKASRLTATYASGHAIILYEAEVLSGFYFFHPP